jgi:hypothetical protein
VSICTAPGREISTIARFFSSYDRAASLRLGGRTESA